MAFLPLNSLNGMKNIKDLNLKKEILPLFDFTLNDFSRNVLVDLFSEIPQTLEEILIRQSIIKGLLKNRSLYLPFFYYKSEVNEINEYLNNLGKSNSNSIGSSLRLRLLFARAERNKEGGRLSQLVLFFHKIEQFYFSHLQENDFPTLFKSKIRNMKTFFSDLDLEKYASIAQQRSFRIAEIAGLMDFLFEKVRKGEVNLFLNDFYLFEAFLSISKGILKHGFIFPEFNEEFSIANFYHPLLKYPVKNSFKTMNAVTLITGPNMSGKSTLLRALGICVVLAHLGFAVPADRCQIPFFEVISVCINLNDDLKSGFSHFMSEIRSLKAVLLEANQSKKCFAVFDELFRGTNTEDALAISKTTILGLTKFTMSFFIISTHQHKLKEEINGSKRQLNTCFIECKLKDNQPQFTYKLRDGWSDLKIGQIIFEQEGLNQLLRNPFSENL
jgi:DNA mismatch repair protein MutS